MSMVEHLEELRRRLMVVIAAIAVAAIAGFFVSETVLNILRAPLPDEFQTLFFTSPAGAFVARLKIAGFVGVALAMPVIMYELYRFVTPGLLPGERRLLWPFLLAGVLLFALGVVIGYLILPLALTFLYGFAGEGIEPLPVLEEYIGFVTTLLIVFGLMLQFPVVLFVLSRLGIVTPSWLASRRRWAILIIAIVSAVSTPGGDPFSMVVLALLMYGLFEATLIVVRTLQRRDRKAAAAQDEAAQDEAATDGDSTPDAGT